MSSPAPSDLHAHIVAALTKARRAAKLRQVDLAKRLDWQQAYVSRYETGERMLGVDEYVAVALAIGVDPIALLGNVLQSGQDKPASGAATEDASPHRPAP